MYTDKRIHTGIYKIQSIPKLQNMSSNCSNRFVEDSFFYQHRVVESVQTNGSGGYAPLLGRAGLLEQT